ncbi:hypothetical protein [Kitasatospora sp. A2-31]|uniref:hypothetical protein n=1 Tax=Kitasatospora sp. A2-31 TaxID=2916414 RepID=UPI001EE9C632|nr:hypothetical protein [Kitasatospora sp. A2-31]MCG6496273.1 hypothetical protein [Kitasatospora sp. A2-31]
MNSAPTPPNGLPVLGLLILILLSAVLGGVCEARAASLRPRDAETNAQPKGS